jgi:hypothetical protein
MAVRGLAAALRTESKLPLGSYNFVCDAINNAVGAAERGVQLQAADVFSLGISCIKLAAAAGNSPKAEDRLRAPYMLTLSYTLAEAIRKLHASAGSTAAPAISSTSSSSNGSRREDQCGAANTSTTSSSSGLSLAVLIWARILCKLGQGFETAGSMTPAEPSSQHAAAGAAADAASAEQQAVEDSEAGYTSSAWPSVLTVCSIGLRALTEQLLPSLQLPGVPGSQEACSAAHQQLTQQCKQLQGQLEVLNDAVNEAGLSWSSQFYLHHTSDAPGVQLPQGLAAAVLKFGQQLGQLGEALCAQLPVPLCCNNPGCESLSGASEQLLVAGKGSVCSRCK